jgi:hypothetical protein
VSTREESHRLIDRLSVNRIQAARKVLEELCGETDSSASAQPPIEAILRELAAQVPREEWERLHADLTDQLDLLVRNSKNVNPVFADRAYWITNDRHFSQQGFEVLMGRLP